MSADFWAGYVSGAVGIVIGNPLDLIKVRLQAKDAIPAQTTVSYARQFETPSSLVTGTAAPVLGYGALNALLFVSYNRSEAAINNYLAISPNLWTTWAAGAIGGLATWVVSTPTELVKCRAQLSLPPTSSWKIARQIVKSEGFRGLYFGGVVTALRDSIGYGFYFWSYELSTQLITSSKQEKSLTKDAARVLLCGGLAGVVTWASVFPLDVIKTRVQAQTNEPAAMALLGDQTKVHRRAGAIEVAKEAYRQGGLRVFFRGLTICSVRAFVVSAIQWAVYEGIMHELDQGKQRSVEPV
ncbi:mitochondrial carrier domain-containing protein [Pseudomassariella vexata]|uniref:Mitochondrial carrier domain-containing protein n=1 Tax=Pseudomassariella vexata TaxID=1141098 RepID=A0A1Y2DJ25_9PEZI|nr:mitochondrial carrier domain-containing protein [Pseudomassariella vexata]ORY58815.1 mitochondrial carrier domain-containing protein [Pseudomassariella vexata]